MQIINDIMIEDIDGSELWLEAGTEVHLINRYKYRGKHYATVLHGETVFKIKSEDIE